LSNRSSRPSALETAESQKAFSDTGWTNSQSSLISISQKIAENTTHQIFLPRSVVKEIIQAV